MLLHAVWHIMVVMHLTGHLPETNLPTTTACLALWKGGNRVLAALAARETPTSEDPKVAEFDERRWIHQIALALHAVSMRTRSPERSVSSPLELKTQRGRKLIESEDGYYAA